MALVHAIEDAYEARAVTVIGNALGVIAQELAARLRADDAIAITAAGGDPLVISAADWARALGTDGVDLVGDVVVDSTSRAALVIGTNVTDQAVANVVDRHMANLQAWGAKLSDEVAEAVREGVAAGRTVDEVVSDLTTGSGPLSVGQARRIARTELPAAANGGMFAGWQTAGVVAKRWKTRDDPRVRFAHRVTDGQTRPLELPFDVAGRSAMYPGDPGLPVDLRANCRCFMDRVDVDGVERPADLASATVGQLADVARAQGIPAAGLRKAGLLSAIEAHRAGAGQRLDSLSRVQMLLRAKAADVRGRWAMTRGRLMSALRGRNPDRPGTGTLDRPPVRTPVTAAAADAFRADAGYVTRGDLLNARARASRRAARSATGIQSTTDPVAVRARVFADYGGNQAGYVPCTGCGLKLHWTRAADANPAGHQVMVRMPIRDGEGLAATNVMPGCPACADTVARTGPGRILRRS